MKPQHWIICIFTFLLGLMLALHSLPPLREGLSRRHWPKTVGTVVTAYVTAHPDVLPAVVYRYEVGGRVFQDTSLLQAPGFGTRSKRREVALKSIATFPDGHTVTVYYDPKRPEHATLVPHPAWWVYGQFATGIVVLLVGIILMLRLPAGKRRERKPNSRSEKG